MFRKILIATHGTLGAKQAESYAIGLARKFGAELYGLYVIHKDWSSLIGIEWLHSSNTRMDFYRYAESEFKRRATEVLQDLKSHADGIACVMSIKVGEPAEVIANEARQIGVDLIIIGSNCNRRSSEEYKAKVSLKRLLKLAPCPVFIVNTTTDGSISAVNCESWEGFRKGYGVSPISKGGDTTEQ